MGYKSPGIQFISGKKLEIQKKLTKPNSTADLERLNNSKSTANPGRSDHALTCGKTNGRMESNKPVRESKHIHLQSPHTHAQTYVHTLKWTVKGH